MANNDTKKEIKTQSRMVLVLAFFFIGSYDCWSELCLF